MAKKNKEVRIYPQRREPDAARLAQALLHLVDHIPPRERDKFAAHGERLLEEMKPAPKAKGSAA